VTLAEKWQKVLVFCSKSSKNHHHRHQKIIIKNTAKLYHTCLNVVMLAHFLAAADSFTIVNDSNVCDTRLLGTKSRCSSLRTAMSTVHPIDGRHHLIDQVGSILAPACFKLFCILNRTSSQVFSAFDEEKKGHLSRKQLKSANVA
jgi:hypothetical protein